MNTILCGSTSALTAFILKPVVMKCISPVSYYNLSTAVHGLIAGLVSVYGCCDNIETYSAIVIGIIAAGFYIIGCIVLFYLKNDDPVNFSQIFGFGGLWGTLAVGLFDNDSGVFFDHTAHKLAV